MHICLRKVHQMHCYAPKYALKTTKEIRRFYCSPDCARPKQSVEIPRRSRHQTGCQYKSAKEIRSSKEVGRSWLANSYFIWPERPSLPFNLCTGFWTLLQGTPRLLPRCGHPWQQLTSRRGTKGVDRKCSQMAWRSRQAEFLRSQ